jgi:phage/plasmid-like protein (TIGR03299 family)
MAHEIFGERFFGYRQPAWHGLGTVFEGAKTALEALDGAGLDYQVEKCPILIHSSWGEVETGQIALVRQPTADDPQPRQFAVVNGEYGLLQNRDLAEMFEEMSREWPVETAGALGRGERIFMTFQMGGLTVGGDAVEQFLLLNECKNGSGGINIKYTTTRVVCANTLQMALGDSFETVNLNHTADVKDKLGFERDLMLALRKATAEKAETLTALADLRITEEQAGEVFAAAHPNPKKPMAFRFAGVNPDAVGSALWMREKGRADAAHKEWELRCNRLGEFRAACQDLYVKLGDEYPTAAGTAWHAINAVTELADHRQGLCGDATSAAFAASEYNRRSSVMYGSRAMEKANALGACLELLRVGGAASAGTGKARGRGVAVAV